ncbi:polyphenol oxidase family protein [Moraxella sp. ZJ142]|uniref:polyphenol oxidase family protein n=1 Tax=Moraxella marmotae TaxID=3344520 RepID=UPI0035D4D50E
MTDNSTDNNLANSNLTSNSLTGNRPKTLPLDTLYKDDKIWVVQTHAGNFDKFAKLPQSQPPQQSQSSQLYGEFNLGLHVKDDPNAVLIRRAELLANLQNQGAKIDRIHWLNQVHGDAVVDADRPQVQSLKSADALISSQRHIALAIMTADCVPVALFDDKGSAIACIHAGWQGLTNGIIAKTAQQMPPLTQPKAVIGACISQAAYEIDLALAQRIVQTVAAQNLVAGDAQALFEQIIIVSDTPDKVRIDIAKLARLELEHSGFSVVNSPMPCSYLSPNYYSYRAQTHANKAATGRMAMLVMMALGD